MATDKIDSFLDAPAASDDAIDSFLDEPTKPGFFAGAWKALAGIPHAAEATGLDAVQAANKTVGGALQTALDVPAQIGTAAGILPGNPAKSDEAKSPIQFHDALDRWLDDTRDTGEEIYTPDPKTTGALGQVGFGATDFLTRMGLGVLTRNPEAVIGLPAATTGYEHAIDLMKHGVDAGTAAEAGVSNAGITATLGLLPGAGATRGVLQRMIADAGANVGLGAASRATDKAALKEGGYDEMASQSPDVFDPKAMLTDAAAGAAFPVAHVTLDAITGKPIQWRGEKPADAPAAAPAQPARADVDAVADALRASGMGESVDAALNAGSDPVAAITHEQTTPAVQSAGPVAGGDVPPVAVSARPERSPELAPLPEGEHPNAPGNDLPPPAPDAPVDPMLADRYFNDIHNEIGWDQVGGRIVRDGSEAADGIGPDPGRAGGSVVGRTSWIGRARVDGNGESDFWRNRPANARLTPERAQAALDKARSGEPLAPIEQRFVDYARQAAHDYAQEHANESARYEQELQDQNDIQRQRDIEDARNDGAKFTSADANDALTLDGWIMRALDAGVPAGDLAPMIGQGTMGERVMRLAQAIKQRGNEHGTDAATDGLDSAVSDSTAREGQDQQPLPAGEGAAGEGRAGEASNAEPVAGAYAAQVDNGPVMQRRAGAASADLFGGQNPEPRTRAEAAPRAENGDLFGGPSMRDRVDAAERAKDATRNGENADRASDKGTLFEKPEPTAPEQAEVPGGGGSELPAVRETFATQKEAGMFAANLKGDARVHKAVGKDGKSTWVVERKAGKPEPLLARGEPAGESGLGVEKVQAVARGVLGKNSAHVPVDVVASLKDLPDKPRKAVEAEGVKDGDIKAFHYDGRSYILADQMHSERDVRNAVFHEHYTHGGLRALYGKELGPKLDMLLQRIGGMKGLLKLADKDGIDLHEYVKAGDPPLRLMEELLAHKAHATGSLKQMIREWFGRVRAWIRSKGYADLSNYGDTDLANVLRQAREAIRERDGLPAKQPMFQRVFHGTPHRGIEAEGFKLNKIGSGEGAQAYGWGMYFAGRREIAERYREALSPASNAYAATDDAGRWNVYARKGGQGIGAGDEQVAGPFNTQKEASDHALSLRKNDDKGQLYHAEIPEDHDLLDWDKPLREQPEAVRTKLEEVGKELPEWAHEMLADNVNADWMDLTGSEAYQFLGRLASEDGLPNQAAYDVGAGNPSEVASKFLNAQGIPGLRYLDSTSRAAGDGSHNYVIWDESHLNNDVTPYYQRNAARNEPPGGSDERGPNAHLTDNLPIKREEPARAGDKPNLDGDDPELPPRAPGESHTDWMVRTLDGARNTLVDGVKDFVGIKSWSKEERRKLDITKDALRAMMSNRVRNMDRAETKFRAVQKAFDRIIGKDAQRNLDAIDDYETGRPIADKAYKLFFDVMQKELDSRWQKIVSIKPGLADDFIENYFPHLYKDPTRAGKWYQQELAAKRPLTGTKGFMKQRKYPTLREAMSTGLEPISQNPVDFVLARVAQMDKFLATHNLIERDLKSRGWMKDVDAGQRAPYGYAFVDDQAFAKAAGLQGRIAVPEPVANAINTYLNPGFGNMRGYRMFRAASNALIAARLSWSAFHAGFTTWDVGVTHVDAAGRYLLSGQFMRGLTQLARMPASPLIAPMEGGRLNKIWLGKDVKEAGAFKQALGLSNADGNTLALLDALEHGGARRLMHSSDEFNSIHQFTRAVRQHNVKDGALQLIPAFSQLGSWLIHYKLVPAQKMAARVLLLKQALDEMATRHGVGEAGDYAGIIDAMNPDAVREIAGRVVRTVDSRLGQMNYDNLFMNKHAQHVGQALFQAFGWQIGTVTTVTGGVRDLTTLIKPNVMNVPLDKAGKITDAKYSRLSERTSYLFALMLVSATSMGILNYAMTGEPPKEVNDFFNPRTGKKNRDGSDERLQFPTYWMDHYKIARHPIETFSHKLNPMFSIVADLWRNQDYFGTQIINKHASISTQAKELGDYLFNTFMPFSVTNAKKVRENTDSKVRLAASLFGVTPAPASVTRTAFQEFVSHNGNLGFGHEVRTKLEADRSQTIHDIEAQVRDGGNLTEIMAKMKADGVEPLSRRELNRVRKESRVEIPELQFNRMSIEDKLEAWDKATPEEREKYHLRSIIMRSKVSQSDTFRRMPDDEKENIRKQLKKIANYQSKSVDSVD